MTAPADMTNDEMDAAVAERVMGWVRYEAKTGPEWCEPHESTRGKTGVVRANVADWSPTIDPRDSRMVVERMRELGYAFYTYSGPYGHAAAFTQWSRDAPKFNDDDVRDSLDRAICEAALEALSQ